MLIMFTCVRYVHISTLCSHQYIMFTSVHSIPLQREVYVMTVNMVLSALAMFHLAYLGLMFDNSPDDEQVIRNPQMFHSHFLGYGIL